MYDIITSYIMVLNASHILNMLYDIIVLNYIHMLYVHVMCIIQSEYIKIYILVDSLGLISLRILLITLESTNFSSCYLKL